MLHLLKTRAKFSCPACPPAEVKRVSPEVSDNFGPASLKVDQLFSCSCISDKLLLWVLLTHAAEQRCHSGQDEACTNGVNEPGRGVCLQTASHKSYIICL